jgi:hypothetical protein
MIRVVINCVRQARRKSKRYGQAIRHSNDDVADGFGACEVASDVGCLGHACLASLAFRGKSCVQ